MPKRTDITTICIIGAGPIVIGQACEFDYSGVQACKALRQEGYRIVLVNSNPATIMTDPDLADATYIEPITPEMVAKILERERPDALLPTMGGQTALNTAMALAKDGTLERLGIQLIGANRAAIEKAEDRFLFREAMEKIGLSSPKSSVVKSMPEAEAALPDIGLPAIIRPSFTLAGTGGGIAYNRTEYAEIVASGLAASPMHEVLVEESVLGWKEYEMEVVRDRNDNCIIICSIENIDPMGVHTGDSITVAPALTLTDKEYQIMRNASIAVLREIGVDTGGSNVQFAVNPIDGRMVVIEMNPRVSRSSALASKATGFPIAKIAAKLAVGYTLDELKNDITGDTPASFEPTIDYVVTKIPRFAFEKFPGTEPLLTTAMKSVGEVMAIGRNFHESMQKALRGLEIGLTGFNEMRSLKGVDIKSIHAALARPTPDRILVIAEAFRHGMTSEQIHAICKYDTWFLDRIAEIVATENNIRATGLPQDAHGLKKLKHMGFSDARLAQLTGTTESAVRKTRQNLGVTPVFKRIDTCAGEFASATPYLYSTYEASHTSSNIVPNNVVIRRASPNKTDAEAILRVHSEAILTKAHGHYSPEQISAWIKAAGTIEEEMKRLAEPDSITFIAESGGAVIGFARLSIAKGILGAVYVTKDTVRGTGTKLLNIAEAEAHKKGLQSLSLDSSLNAESFYARHGYKIEKHTTHQLPDGTILPCIQMRKTGLELSISGSSITSCESHPTAAKKVVILGGGPNRIGQGIEFDYCCVHAVMALREQGYETIMVNCNPETVSTDYDTSDRLYFEPLTAEDVIEILRKEQSNGTLLGVFVQFGGQTPLKLAHALQNENFPILGTSPDAIDLAEDRERFQVLLNRLKLKQPANGLARNVAEAEKVVEQIGYPIVVRPSYVLGGRGMQIVYDVDALRAYVEKAVHVSGSSPILIDHYLQDAIEVDVDVVADKTDVFVAGIMEHIEEAGIHSGDSSCALPPHSLPKHIVDEIGIQSEMLAKSIGVIGLMNVQFAVKGEEIYILEVNPRASRTVPFVAKAIGIPIAKIAARVMVGEKLADMKLERGKRQHLAVKTPVFPFARFPGVDVVLGPEMRSTGEVMGLDNSFARAYAKAQMGAGIRLPLKGTCFLSVKDTDKPTAILMAWQLLNLGFRLVATAGTAETLKQAGVPVERINKVYEGQPHVVDAMINDEIQIMINTTAGGSQNLADSFSLRRTALMRGIPHITTIPGARAAIEAISALQTGTLEVTPLQEYLKVV